LVAVVAAVSAVSAADEAAAAAPAEVSDMAWKRFDPKVAARDAVAAARGAVGDRLSSAVLYGSAAMGTFDTGRSDLNVAFVLEALDAPTLEALRPAHREWTRLRLARPLLLTGAILAESRDTFPLEYLLIRTFHEPLHGPDAFAGLTIERAALRLQVERTLRTQSLLLSWSYLEGAGSATGARHWAQRAGTSIAASVAGLLHLAGETIPAPRAELAARAAARFGVPEGALRDVLLPPGDRNRIEASTLFDEARDCLKRMLDAVERMDASPESKS
jgi:predicted nucleotidyltransferase